MKLCRFYAPDADNGKALTGVVEGDRVFEVIDPWPGTASRSGRQWPFERVRLLPPAVPTKLVCAARNYRAHATEMQREIPTEPQVFLKPPSSLIASGDTIELPPGAARIDCEGELAVVIGRRCYRLGPKDDIAPYVAGYTCINDVSARDFQKKDGVFGRAKGFDTFGPLGPVIETQFDWKQARIETRINGTVRQSAPATDMIFPVDELVRFITQVMTLLPGDVIATGTPQGVSALSPGDVVEVSIEGIGVLRNPVAARKSA